MGASPGPAAPTMGAPPAVVLTATEGAPSSRHPSLLLTPSSDPPPRYPLEAVPLPSHALQVLLQGAAELAQVLV